MKDGESEFEHGIQAYQSQNETLDSDGVQSFKTGPMTPDEVTM